MKTPTDSPVVMISLLSKPKQEVIAYANSDIKTDPNNHYLFRLANDNIIKFVHSYNFDSNNGNNIGNTITLELIDPEGFFETRVFLNSELLFKSDPQIVKDRAEAQKEFERREQIKSALLGLSPSISTIKSISFDRTFSDVVSNTDYLGGRGSMRIVPTEELNSKLTEDIQNQIIDDLAQQIDLSKARDTNTLEYSKLILSKLKKQNLIKYSFGTATQKNATISTLSNYSVDVTASFDTSNIPALFEELKLDSLDKERQLIPTPYFYFYYGLGSNPNNWSGPISAQFVDAKYNYSFETGKKSTTMTFSTTFDFPAFSRYALDLRGVTNIITPEYIVIGALKNTGSFDSPQGSFHAALSLVIKNYLRTITSPNINISVLLPDLDKIINDKIINYINYFKTKQSTPIKEIAGAMEYVKIIEDMGFDVTLIRDKYNKYSIGDSINQIASVKSNNAGYNNSYLLEFYAKNPENNTVYICASLSKPINESYLKPLEKIIAGIKNITGLIDLGLEVIDNTEFINTFSQHIISKSFTNINPITNPANPLLVFGDSYIMENYLYGKKFYSIKGIIQEKQVTTEAGDQNELSLIDRIKKGANKADRSYLHEIDSQIFSEEYITDIASKYFLNIDVALAINSGSFSIPDDELSIDANIRKNIEASRIPIFKSGLKESNLLNVDLDFNDFYFSTLKSVWAQIDQLNLITNSNVDPTNIKDLDVFGDANKIKELTNAIDQMSITLDKEKQIPFNKLYGELTKPDYAQFLGLDNEKKSEKVQKLISYFGSLQNNTGVRIKLIMGNHENRNSYIQYLSFFSRIVNQSFKGYIKTLPSFHITGTKLSTCPILLLLNEVNTPPYQNSNFITRMFNGLYQVWGYQHTISSSELCSEFFITKSIRLEFPIIIEPEKK
jgi:hypothetical protein